MLKRWLHSSVNRKRPSTYVFVRDRYSPHIVFTAQCHFPAAFSESVAHIIIWLPVKHCHLEMCALYIQSPYQGRCKCDIFQHHAQIEPFVIVNYSTWEYVEWLTREDEHFGNKYLFFDDTVEYHHFLKRQHLPSAWIFFYFLIIADYHTYIVNQIK